MVAEQPTSTATALQPCLLPGAGYLRSLAHRFLQRCGPAKCGQLAAVAQHFPGGLRVGTCCSGTDSPLMCWDAICEAIRENGLGDVRVRAVFASEKDKRKREFLSHMRPRSTHIFEDTVLLGEGIGIDLASGKRVPCAIPSVHILVGGFPCTDVSPLNSKASSTGNSSCISSGSLSTGSCFQGILSYIRRHAAEIKVVVLENVIGLLRRPNRARASNAAVVMKSLTDEGFMMKLWILNPQMFGAPQHRRRLWFIGMKRSLLAGTGISEAEALGVLEQSMRRMVGGTEAQPLEAYLCSEKSEVVRRHLAECSVEGDWTMDVALRASWGLYAPAPHRAMRQAKQARHAEKGKQEMPKWIAQHRELCDKHGVDWATLEAPDRMTRFIFPGLQKLGDREFDLLALQGVRDYPEAQTRIVDTSQAAIRVSTAKKKRKPGASFFDVDTPPGCPIITPGGRKYVTSRCRLLTGAEQLRFQNIWLDQEIMDSFPEHLLSDLAGNAFETSCCTAALFSVLEVLAHILSNRR